MNEFIYSQWINYLNTSSWTRPCKDIKTDFDNWKCKIFVDFFVILGKETIVHVVIGSW